jgi:DNA-binding FadR family transcriptional regulator
MDRPSQPKAQQDAEEARERLREEARRLAADPRDREEIRLIREEMDELRPPLAD